MTDSVTPTLTLATLQPALMAMIEQWPGAVLLLDESGRLIWCNETTLRLSGSSADDPRGLAFAELRLPWSLDSTQLDAARAGVPIEVQQAADEDHHWQVRLRRLEINPELIATLCIAELQSAPRAQVHADLEQSFDAAQAGTWHWNMRDDEASVDDAWCQHHQLDACSGANHIARWISQIHPDDIGDFRRRLAELRSGSNSYFEAEYRILTRDHRWLWILQRGRVVARDDDGVPVRSIGICIEIDQRKREETSSKANESRLATALWGARAAFWQWHLPTDVRTMSPLWFAMTRYTREQWDSIRDPWQSRVNSEDFPAVLLAVRNYQAGISDCLEYEYRLMTANGEWRWILDRARAVEWDLDGKPAVIMGVSLDIDAQKRSEMALRASEARLQTAVWGARMGLKEIDLERNSARWYDRWCDEYGVDPCEGSGHRLRWQSLMHPADIEGVARRFEAHLDGKQDFYDSEYRLMTRGGVWRWIFERGRVIERAEDGRAKRMVFVCMDIDARRQEQMQQHFSQPWLEGALECARGAMWQWQTEPRVITYTDTYYKLFGVDPLVGRTNEHFWRERLHPEDADRVLPKYWEVVENRRDRFEDEYRMRCEDGRWIWVLDRAQAVARDVNGRALRLVGFVLDVTTQRAQREALQVSQERFLHATIAAQGIIYDADYETGRAHRIGTEVVIGYKPEEIGELRDHWIALIHPDDKPHFSIERPVSHTGPITSELEYRVRHRDGYWVRVRDRAVLVAEADGRPLRRVGFIEEISAAQARPVWSNDRRDLTHTLLADAEAIRAGLRDAG